MNRYVKLILGVAVVVAGLGFIVYFNTLPTPNPSSSPSPSPSETTEPTAFDIEGCYAYEADDGTRYTLYIDATDEKNFYGFKEYNNPGFDSSRGVFVGQFIDRIALGIYDFEAEGSRSKRQLAFLFENGNFVRMIGDMEIVDGVEKFKDLENLSKDDNYVYLPSSGCATT